ncbi:N-acetylmuramoyl-L-alanine amidase family protein [Snuella sedimenti]|uniref:N-acetylmuramoyl-L-alanine amidase n=1 Tax=Snuella sedimenti TaxID=2798802 RepID=A0A8J7J5C7_9FLAO|nr:N-acetylmuramoyl-L-alanine amidase [Snuella sedimenti]MBJ6368864.1 N-acetylmuramoyl-L-alanine amidase [Snuella sedimenti]
MKTHKALRFVSLISLLTFLIFINVGYGQDSDKFIVVLDAGHGGDDPGNLGNGFKEKDIALKIVLEVGKQLEQTPGVKVIYTRKSDVFIGLKDRGKIANKANADLFVSVHCNAHGSQAHGTETFVLGTHRNQTNFEVAKRENSVIFLEDNYEENYGGFDPNSPESVMSILLSQEEFLDQSIMLASLIQKKFTEKLKRKNRGVKQAGFVVLHQTVMPSVLVETGFLTYKNEGSYLNSKKGQSEISAAISKAVLEYKKSLDNNVGDVTFVETPETEETGLQSEILSDIIFKVQIATGSKALEPKAYNFKGLQDVSRVKEGTLYKYYYGETSDYNKTKTLLEVAKKKGYASSFVVAFKNGKKVALTEAIKTATN